MELVPAEPGLFPVGRLDRDTEGLLLFTNDGEVANRVMHPRYGLTKEYLVSTPIRPSDAIMNKIRSGIAIDGKVVVPHEFRLVRETPNGVILSVVLHEGMNHVVRRLMESVGIPISHLHRSRIGPLSIAGIPRGSHRELTHGELVSLRQSLRLAPAETETVIRPSRPTGTRVKQNDGSSSRHRQRQ